MRSSITRAAPADVYYVVETSGRILGERQHCVASSLYETTSQAQTELTRLLAKDDGKAYSVWKGSTYVEPARWAYDVVLEDGTLLRAEQQAPLPPHSRRRDEVT